MRDFQTGHGGSKAYQGPHLHKVGRRGESAKGSREARVKDGRGGKTDQVAQKSMMTSLSPPVTVLKVSNESITATMSDLFLVGSCVRVQRRGWRAMRVMARRRRRKLMKTRWAMEERERDGQGHWGTCLYDQEQGVLTQAGRMMR